MVTCCPEFVQAYNEASFPQNLSKENNSGYTVNDTHLMMVTNCDIVISWGTKNLVLSSWGRLISLRNLSTMTWNHKRKIYSDCLTKHHQWGYIQNLTMYGMCGSVVGWGTMLQARRSRFDSRLVLWIFLKLPNPYSRTMDLGSIQPLTDEYQESSWG
jgi:hypothetical protein